MMIKGNGIALVCLDAKGRVVIPKRLREKACIEAGQSLLIYAFESILVISRTDMGKSCLSDITRRLCFSASLAIALASDLGITAPVGFEG